MTFADAGGSNLQSGHRALLQGTATIALGVERGLQRGPEGNLPVFTPAALKLGEWQLSGAVTDW
jgi:hypothetical protein